MAAERHGPPRLARWDDGYGSSAGYWLLRDVPGLVLVYTGSSWQLHAGQELFVEYPAAPERVWGPGFDPRPGGQLLAVTPALREAFSTRGAALLALEAVLEEAPRSVLGEALA